MPGRPRKVVGISTGKIGKEKKANRARQEAELKVSRARIEESTPEFINDSAALEFRRVVDTAAEAGILDDLDMAALAIYANAYERYRIASVHLNEDGLMDTDSKGHEIPSKWLKVQADAENTIMKISTKIGLFTTDRLKLVVPTKEEKKVNKFLKYVD